MRDQLVADAERRELRLAEVFVGRRGDRPVAPGARARARSRGGALVEARCDEHRARRGAIGVGRTRRAAARGLAPRPTAAARCRSGPARSGRAAAPRAAVRSERYCGSLVIADRRRRSASTCSSSARRRSGTRPRWRRVGVGVGAPAGPDRRPRRRASAAARGPPPRASDRRHSAGSGRTYHSAASRLISGS